MKKVIIAALLSLLWNTLYAQVFYLGAKLTPSSDRFEPLGASTQTGIYTYRYTKPINDLMYKRRVGDIIVGVKDGYIATTIYNLIPDKGDIGVPAFIIKTIKNTIGYPLQYKNGVYGANVDNISFAVCRKSDVITFNKDRIVLLTTVKSSILSNR